MGEARSASAEDDDREPGEDEDEGRERDEPEDRGGEPTVDVHLRSTFRKSVDEGVARLNRTWPDLLATGFVGGLDVSLGILALLLIEEATESTLLGALGFTIGFIALTLGKSELFTENFLVPVAALAARKSTVGALLRLWLGTAVMNLVGGWIFAWLMIVGFPKLEATAIRVGEIYTAADFLELSGMGVLAGITITFMTWMEHGSRSEFGKIIAVSTAAFLLAAGPLNHIVVVSIEIFAAIHTGHAPFGYLEWARVAIIALVTNVLGGLLLVTVLRLVQVGPESIERERQND